MNGEGCRMGKVRDEARCLITGVVVADDQFVRGAGLGGEAGELFAQILLTIPGAHRYRRLASHSLVLIEPGRVCTSATRYTCLFTLQPIFSARRRPGGR